MDEPALRLRPLTLGDILDGVFRIYRSNFLTLIGITAVLQTPMILLQLALTVILGQQVTTDLLELAQRLPRFNPQEDSFNEIIPVGFVLFLLISLGLGLIQGVIVQQLIDGALTKAVSRRYMGLPISIGSAYNFGVNRMIALIMGSLVLTLASTAVIGLAVGLGVGLIALVAGATQSIGQGAVTAVIVLLGFGLVLLMLALMLGVLAVLVRFIFFTQAVVLEGQGALAALGRSWRLVQGSFWRVLGVLLIVWLLLYVISLVPTVIASTLIQLFFSDPEDFMISQGLSTLVGYCVQILLLPIQFCAYTLLYYDLRVRREGYDLELMAGASSGAVMGGIDTKSA